MRRTGAPPQDNYASNYPYEDKNDDGYDDANPNRVFGIPDPHRRYGMPSFSITITGAGIEQQGALHCFAHYGKIPSGLLGRNNWTAGEYLARRIPDEDGAYLENPLLTERTRGAVVQMYQEEMHPFVVIKHGKHPIVIQGARGGNGSLTPPPVYHTIASLEGDSGLGDTPEVVSINLAPLMTWQSGGTQGRRRYFRILFGEPDSEAVVGREIHIMIEDAPPSRQQCLALFLNSMGVWEKILLHGDLTFGKSFAESQTDAMQLNQALQTFVPQRQARKGKGIYTLNTGLCSPARLSFAAAMAASEQILLYLPHSSAPVPVKCTASETQIYTDADTQTPRGIELTFEEETG